VKDAYFHCESLVRDADKDRFLAALFVPAERRPHVLALYAFNVEIARIRDQAREPLPGEIRLQWWRDALVGHGHGGVSAHPVAAALGDTIDRFGLSRQSLLDLIDAWEFDLYDDPMGTLGELEEFARKASSTLFGLAARILSTQEAIEIARAAGPAGIAYAITGLLQAFPRHVARRQLYVPRDLLDRHGATLEAVWAGQASPALSAALAELRAHAHAKLDESTARLAAVPSDAAPAFLPLAVLPAVLGRLQRSGSNPFAAVEVPQWRRQWALWRAARRLKG
jgi:15-cis-phytoene synthase